MSSTDNYVTPFPTPKPLAPTPTPTTDSMLTSGTDLTPEDQKQIQYLHRLAQVSSLDEFESEVRKWLGKRSTSKTPVDVNFSPVLQPQQLSDIELPVLGEMDLRALEDEGASILRHLELDA